MVEPTTSNFMVEKEEIINFYQSTPCHNQDSFHRHRYLNLKHHTKAKNATSISFSVRKSSLSQIFQNFKNKNNC